MSSIDIKDVLAQYNKKDNKKDFGFTSESEEDYIAAKTTTVEVSHKEKLKQVEELIMPLLVNLLETADKPIINWPNRKPILEEKIKDLLKLTRS